MTQDRNPAVPPGSHAADGRPASSPTPATGTSQSKPAGDRLPQLLRLVEAEPNDAFLLYGVAQEYGRRGATDEAVRWYDRCLAVDPAYCYAYYHKAKALEEADRIPEAVEVLRAGLIKAKAVRDAQAINEISGFLDAISD